jgi:hypothetical protein
VFAVSWFAAHRCAKTPILASCAPKGQPVAQSPEEQFFQARSSVWLERYLDTVEVSGSSPLGPTISFLEVSKPFTQFHLNPNLVASPGVGTCVADLRQVYWGH